MSAASRRDLREDALAIWRAGVDAVDSQRLAAEAIGFDGRALRIVDDVFPADEFERIVVVGAGKASAGMAAGVEESLGDDGRARFKLSGWVNVPEDCVRPLACVRLHGGRPAGVNEPTEAGVAGTRRIRELVEGLGPNDLCLCLISGGGSALLVDPIDGVSLADKQAVSRLLSRGGANIRELNAVRKRLSRVKGGGLLRACRAGRLTTLVISDVLGDPLDVIASGPTIDDAGSAAEAIDVLTRFDPDQSAAPARVWAALRRQTKEHDAPLASIESDVHVIGNLAVAVDGAGVESVERGYAYLMTCAREMEGPAEEIGRAFARQVWNAREASLPSPDCFISGGEPTVRLPRDVKPGRGGRNQQLALAALIEWLELAEGNVERLAGLTLLSGGTDGEDGPTDAAGAIVDIEVARRSRALGLNPHDHLTRCDAYPFFAATGGLVKTGPTHTNVCDVRVALVARR